MGLARAQKHTFFLSHLLAVISNCAEAVHLPVNPLWLGRYSFLCWWQERSLWSGGLSAYQRHKNSMEPQSKSYTFISVIQIWITVLKHSMPGIRLYKPIQLRWCYIMRYLKIYDNVVQQYLRSSQYLDLCYEFRLKTLFKDLLCCTSSSGLMIDSRSHFHVSCFLSYGTAGAATDEDAVATNLRGPLLCLHESEKHGLPNMTQQTVWLVMIHMNTYYIVVSCSFWIQAAVVNSLAPDIPKATRNLLPVHVKVKANDWLCRSALSHWANDGSRWAPQSKRNSSSHQRESLPIALSPRRERMRTKRSESPEYQGLPPIVHQGTKLSKHSGHVILLLLSASNYDDIWLIIWWHMTYDDTDTPATRTWLSDLCSFATGPAASGHVLKAVEGSRRPWGKLFFGHCRFIHIWPLHPDPENVRCCCWNSSYQSHVAENHTWPRDAQSKTSESVLICKLQLKLSQASILITLLDLFPLNGLNGFMNLVQLVEMRSHKPLAKLDSQPLAEGHLITIVFTRPGTWNIKTGLCIPETSPEMTCKQHQI